MNFIDDFKDTIPLKLTSSTTSVHHNTRGRL